jgi:cytochrome P450
LNASSFRKPMSLVDTHTKNFLGQRALVALNGKEWRLYRSAVHKSFTPAAIQQSQTVICEVGETLVDSLLLLNKRVGQQQPILVLPLMKMATIDVFGLAALSVDFECCKTLQLTPIAAAFDYLTGEYTRRLKRPWDPFCFLYNVPTPANLEHKRQKGLIRSFIAQQITKTREAIQKEDMLLQEVGGAAKRSSSSSSTSDVLTNLIKAAAAEAEAESKNVSDDALGDVMMTLLFGGYDTTRYETSSVQ